MLHIMIYIKYTTVSARRDVAIQRHKGPTAKEVHPLL